MATPSTPSSVATRLGTESTLVSKSSAMSLDSLAKLDSARSQVISLTFTNDNPNNTTITDYAGKAIYEIESEFEGSRTVTYIKKLQDGGPDGDVIGSIEWHELFPDKVSFNGSKKVQTTSFFIGGGLLTYSTTFKDSKGRKYTWKGLGAGLQLALHAEDSENPKLAIAKYQKSEEDRSTDPPGEFPAQLHITPRAAEIQDLVLFTFIVLQRTKINF